MIVLNFFYELGTLPEFQYSNRLRIIYRTLLTLSFVFVYSANFAQETEELPPPEKLKKLSIEELMNIDVMEVTSVSRRPEKLKETPSAIQVITSEDIRRSGATRLPEALQLISNLQIAQVNSHDWGITARGFNGAPLVGYSTLANKMLVMIDGRTVYTPIYGGVNWDMQNVLLEDIDRIEVVSGPGGTLWGANAVNGVINIITKSSKETKGLYVSGAGGSFLQDFAGIRLGGNIDSNLSCRVYGQLLDQKSTHLSSGASANDAWKMTQGGFRIDYEPSKANSLTLQGDQYENTENIPTSGLAVNGQNIVARFTHTISDKSNFKIQTYFDRNARILSSSTMPVIKILKTYDIDFQHLFTLGKKHSIVWGAGYRLVDGVNSGGAIPFNPPNLVMPLYTGFIQDDITFIPDKLKLSIGSKLLHNFYTGFEVQPSARMAWIPTGNQTIWAAVSRAVRTPSRFDADLAIPNTTPPNNPPFIIAPNRNFKSEAVIAYELGYRVRPVDRLSLSIAAFFNHYNNLASLDSTHGGQSKVIFANDLRSESWGLELSGSFQATDKWRFRGGYTYQNKNFWYTNTNVIPGTEVLLSIDPKNNFLVQSVMDLPHHFQFDVIVRYVSTLNVPGIVKNTFKGPSYITSDVRLAWLFKNYEISIVGKNLLQDKHSEFGSTSSSQIPHSIFGKVTCRF